MRGIEGEFLTLYRLMRAGHRPEPVRERDAYGLGPQIEAHHGPRARERGGEFGDILDDHSATPAFSAAARTVARRRGKSAKTACASVQMRRARSVSPSTP